MNIKDLLQWFSTAVLGRAPAQPEPRVFPSLLDDPRCDDDKTCCKDDPDWKVFQGDELVSVEIPKTPKRGRKPVNTKKTKKKNTKKTSKKVKKLVGKK